MLTLVSQCYVIDSVNGTMSRDAMLMLLLLLLLLLLLRQLCI